MKSLSRFCTLVLVAGLLFACSGPTEPDHQSFVYPLAVGNQWIYEYTEISIYSDSTPTDTVRYQHTATVVSADTILPGIVAFTIMREGTDPRHYDFGDLAAYVNMPEGMYAYHRYRLGPHIVLPAPGHVKTDRDRESGALSRMEVPSLFPISGDPLSGIAGDDPTSLVLPYPQHVGHRWTVVDTMENGSFGIDRQIAGWETVTTPAGTFDCVLIDWIYVPPMADVEVFSHFASVGLIRRAVNLLNLVVTTEQFPDGTGETKDIYSKYELVSYTLNRR